MATPSRAGLPTQLSYSISQRTKPQENPQEREGRLFSLLFTSQEMDSVFLVTKSLVICGPRLRPCLHSLFNDQICYSVETFSDDSSKLG